MISKMRFLKLSVVFVAVMLGLATPAQAGRPVLVMADGPNGPEKAGSGVAEIDGTEWSEAPVVQNGLTVNVLFKDPEGTGFRDATLGGMRRARLYDTLRYVADTLNAPGEVNMMVGPSESDGTGALAQGGPMFISADGLTQGNVFERLKTGTAPFPGWAEMVLTFDWGYKWHVGIDAPPPDAVDLRSVLVHEITHCLGFISLMAPDGTSRFSPDTNTYTVFDSMLATKPTLNRLLGGAGSSPVFNGAAADLTGGSVVFIGTSATVAFGNFPPIYSPSPFLQGTSLQHWVEDAIPCGAVMQPRYAYGASRRLYTTVDIATLRDIGWTAAKLAGKDPCSLQPVTIPDVVLQMQVAAVATLTGADLTVGAITQAYSATVLPGRVIAQDPPAGTVVPPSTTVALTVSKGPEPVTVPNVVDQTQADAETAISGAGLKVGTITQAHSATVPSGSVIDQDPPAGSVVAPNTTVALTVSKGPEPVAVPYVLDLTQAAASTVITSAGLRVGTITRDYSATVPSGNVIAQDPPSGSSVAPNTAVSLTVSKGPEVPNVVGETQAAASAAITAAGLTVGAITQECSDTVTTGCVILQSPTAASPGVVSGSAVALVICIGRCNSAIKETVLLPGGVPLEMVWIPGGTFRMGSPDTEQDRQTNEGPQHSVTLSGYWIGKYALTKRQWTAVMGTTPWNGQPSVLSDLDSPAVYVSWNDAQSFFTKLKSNTGKTFRLPSEAEREYVCRASTNTCFYWGDDPGYTAIGDYAWYLGNAGNVMGQEYAHVVGTKFPNAFGLYDVSGNVWEWCDDDWHESYVGAPTGGQSWVDSPRGAFRALRGGSWIGRDDRCRSASRLCDGPEDASYHLGFRVVRTPAPVSVPNVVDLTQAAASTAITDAGLKVGTITQEYSAIVPSGNVMAQDPPAGGSVAPNTAVSLTVSKGPEPVTVPNVVGMPQAAANLSIVGAGLTLGTITEVYSATVPSTNVISQDPVSGTSVAPGTAVALIVSKGPQPVIVPNLVGMAQAAASTAITGAGLTVGSITQAYSATVPSGDVISQDPVADTSVAPGTAVALTVSKGPAPATVTVPNVVDQAQAAASTAITGAGLTVGAITEAYSATVASGNVISQYPVGDASVAAGTAVALTVSKGPEPVNVPNVVGQTQAAASTALTGAGFTVGAITEAYSASVVAGSVVSQDPAAGALAAPGTAVALTVSKGPAPVTVTVPNVVGQTQAAAETAITGAGLTFTITQAYNATVPSGSVISQDPAAGISVDQDSDVALTVSKGPEPVSVTVPNVVGTSQAAATTAIVSAGLALGTVTEAYSATVASGSVISQDPAAGASVATGTAVALTVSKGPQPVVTVPNVVGQAQETAGTTLTGEGLSTGTVTQQCSNSVALGVVVSQNPAADATAPSGSTVALVVSTGPCAPAPPAVSAASNVSTTGFTANWVAAEFATGYRLDLSTSETFSSFVSGYGNLDAGAVTSRIITGLLANTTYYYRVRAYNASGPSGNSDTVTVKTPESPSTYTFTSSVEGSGSVTPASGTTHTPGTALVVTAKPALNWTFDHWEGDLEGVTTNPAGLSMTEDRSVTAVFRLSGPRTLQGTVTNSITKSPVPGVYVEVSKALSKALAHATTGADGRYSMTVAEDTTSVTFTFACPEYLPQTKTFGSPPTDPVDLALVPVGVTTPKGPIANSGPRSVFVEWTANPEYNLKGYYLWRVATDASGSTSGASEKVGGLLKKTEFTDSATTPGAYYKYQVQALSGADRSSDVSPASKPVKAQFLTLFTPKMFVDNTLASLYLWDFTPTNASDNKWVRIPVSARSAYEVTSSQMQIVVDLPTTLLDVTAGADIRVETSGITSGMSVTHSVPAMGELSITANSAGGTARSLYGSGVLFDVYVPKKSSGSCGDMTLVPDTSGGGVRLYDDGTPPKSIPLDLENDQLCITGGDCLHGDVNGDKRIDAQDVQRIREVYVGRITPSACATWAGDINLDGRVDSADAIQLQRWLVGVPINPPAAGTKAAEEILSFATLGDKAVPRPEVWIGQASGTAASTITVPVTIRNAAPLAGFTMTVNFYAGLQGLSFLSAALGSGLPAEAWGISSMDSTTEDHGSVVIAASGSEPVGTYGDTQLVLLSFTVGASVQSGTAIPLSLAAFDGNDSYAVTPRHEAPGQAKIVDSPKSPITQATVPNVVNQSEAAAGTLLHTAGFIAGAVTRQCSDTVATGLVLSQSPLAGASVASGTAVALVVSTGPCGAEGENTVPTEADLRARLTAGFDTVDTNADGTVSFAEAQAALPGLPQTVFNAVNTSGTGQITRGELGLKEPGGCAGCSGNKSGSALDQIKEALGSLFMGGLSLMALLAFGRRRT